jgi:mannan endo-1,4-beta-mannosidase
MGRADTLQTWQHDYGRRKLSKRSAVPLRRLVPIALSLVCMLQSVPATSVRAEPQGDMASNGSTTAAAPGTEAAVVVPPSLYWGAFVDGWPGDSKALDTFEQTVGRKMSIIHWGQPWSLNGVSQGFQTAYFQEIRDRGSIPLIDWGSWDLCCSNEQPDYQLSAIAGGAHDAYITRWAQAAKAWGKPFFLRFDHEMNGWWYPWTEQTNDNQPGEYVRAWQHVHDIFVEQGATNATWVWCPNIVGKYSTPMDQLYPGDDYVDWTCMDGYNWGTDRGNVWISFSEVFNGSLKQGTRDTYDQLVALAPYKPIMIGETAASENGGSKADWIIDMLQGQLPVNFPQVKAFVWFQTDGGDPSLSWYVDSSSPALQAFTHSIASPEYAGNAYSTLEVAPIPPPEVIAPKP